MMLGYWLSDGEDKVVVVGQPDKAGRQRKTIINCGSKR